MKDYAKNRNSNKELSILVVDMMNCYSGLCPSMKELVDSQMEILRLAEKRDIPVINLRDSAKGSRTVREIAQGVKRIPRHRFIVKHYTDGFRETNLYEVLRRFQTREVFLMGLETSFCVLDTAKGAKKRGIKISTSEDVTMDICINPDMFDYNGNIWLSRNGNLYCSYKEHPELK